nr:MAG TPA: Guanylate kinase [Bacteriophage sp.]
MLFTYSLCMYKKNYKTKDMKQKIIAIIGQAGAGKDTVARLLSFSLGIPLICSYTTRPMCEGEKNGREHIFVKECNIPREKMLAYTEYGGYEYWTELSQIEDTAIYVIDEKGIMDICERFPDIELVNIYVAAKPETLKARGISPERMQRDEYRVTMDINSFDYVITNNSSLCALLHAVNAMSMQIKDYSQQEPEISNQELSEYMKALLKDN